LKEKGVELVSVFSLPDFGLPLRGAKNGKLPRNNFELVWRWQSSDPNFFYVAPKSAPALDEDKIYLGSDNGNFWALRQADGTTVWKYKVGWHTKGKNIFSSPAIHKNSVYFGAYDGNLYSLNKDPGKKNQIPF